MTTNLLQYLFHPFHFQEPVLLDQRASGMRQRPVYQRPGDALGGVHARRAGVAQLLGQAGHGAAAGVHHHGGPRLPHVQDADEALPAPADAEPAPLQPKRHETEELLHGQHCW